jgi:hypothetical protein
MPGQPSDTGDAGAAALPPQLLAALLDLGEDAAAVTDRTGRVLWCNPALRALFELAEGALPDLGGLFAASPDALAAVATALRDGELAATEVATRCPTHGERWLRLRSRAAGDRLLWSLRDVTAARRAEVQAGKLAELLALAQEFGRIGMWERDIPSGEGRWDRRMFEFFGLPPGDCAPGRDETTARMHPDDVAGDSYAQSVRQPGRYARRFRVIRPDGSVRWLHSQWEVKPDATGRPQRAIGIMMDDTDVYELARSLSDASAQLALAVELGNIAVWRFDLATRLTHYNDRAFAILGIPHRPQGLTAAEIRPFVHPDDLPRMREAARRALESPRPSDVEARFRRSDGRWRHVLMRRVAQCDAAGRAVGIIGVSLDVTEQVEHRRAAEELARRLERAAASARIGIWSRDLQTEAGDWNEQLFQMCGRDPALGAPSVAEWFDRIVHPDERGLLRRGWGDLAAKRGQLVEYEYRIVRPDGQVRWLADRATREPWADREMVFGVTVDITERRQTEVALRTADERAALAARGAGIATWQRDLLTGEVEWDTQMWRLRGLEPRKAALDADERHALLHPDDLPGYLAATADTDRTHRPLALEFRVRLPDGSYRWLATRSSVVRDAGGRPLRRVGVNWDVTEARAAELARQQQAVAERASHAKSQFLARVSHELRTPLNAVLGFTQLLELDAGRPLAGDRLAQLRHIRHAGEHLLSLINDVLDLTQLESGQLPLRRAAVALEPLVAQAVSMVAPLAARAGVEIHVGSIAGTAAADPTRLLQVLLNLLTNAVKYNRARGEVFVEAAAHAGRVRLAVRDTGPGLARDALAQLFEPFNRLGAERGGIPGTGIGLTISKSLVEQMDGTIAVHSSADQGTTFEVDLPAAGADDHEAPASAPVPLPPQPNAALDGLLLYIEDNPVNVTLVEAIVAGLPGLRLVSAGDGAAGVARALAERPDLVLVDMQLPDIDGLEVLRRLRADPGTADTPCIALSANAMPEDIVRARQAGFDDYWTKPIQVGSFRDALARRFAAVPPAP